MAKNYEYYRVVKARLRFDSGFGNVSTTGALGHVRLMALLDVMHAAPTTTPQITSYDEEASDSPSRNFFCEIPCNDLMRKRFNCRTGAIPVGGAREAYDQFRILGYTEGQAGTEKVGDVYLDYVIALSHPVLVPAEVEPITAVPLFGQREETLPLRQVLGSSLPILSQALPPRTLQALAAPSPVEKPISMPHRQ